MQHAPGFFSEFKSFAVKGNVLDLAVAVVVGNAFGTVITSLVGDIITPLLGLVTNTVDFKTLSFSLRPDLIIRYGAFLQTVFNFLIITLAIFAVFKLIATARERLFKQGEEAVPQYEKPAEERLLEEIRDLLREKR